MESRTILITGAFGFLGSWFLAVLSELNRKVLKRPCRVLALDNFVTGSRNNILDGFSEKNLVVFKRDAAKPFRIKEKIDFIIHAAGVASPVYYMKYPLETIGVAVEGTRNMLNLALEKKPASFLFFSSSEIYGDPHSKHVPTSETYRGHVSSTGPRACYDESKRLGETLCMVYHRLYGVPLKMVRPFNIYGPGMKPDDGRVMPKFLNAALKGEPLPIHGNGLQTRTYCYISDGVTGFFKALFSSKQGEVYNIGNDKNEINLIVLADLISELFNGNVKIIKIPYPEHYPPDEPSRRCPDLTKANTHLKYYPKVDLKTGLARLLSWYKDVYEF